MKLRSMIRLLLITISILVLFPISMSKVRPSTLKQLNVLPREIMLSYSAGPTVFSGTSAEACEPPSDGPSEDDNKQDILSEIWPFIAIPFFLFFGTALYLVYSLCLYLLYRLSIHIITKNLKLSYSWTSSVPTIRVWSVVRAGVSPWWRLILLLLPIGNLLLFLILLARIIFVVNKSLVLVLFFLPAANLIYLGILETKWLPNKMKDENNKPLTPGST